MFWQTKISGEHLHDAERLADFQSAKDAYRSAVAVASMAAQIEAQTRAEYEAARKALRRMADTL